jgi:hypothetical protein
MYPKKQFAFWGFFIERKLLKFLTYTFLGTLAQLGYNLGLKVFM